MPESALERWIAQLVGIGISELWVWRQTWRQIQRDGRKGRTSADGWSATLVPRNGDRTGKTDGPCRVNVSGQRSTPARTQTLGACG